MPVDENCQLCERCQHRDVVVLPRATDGRKYPYVIVLDQPSRFEQATREMGSAKTGDIIASLCAEAQIPITEVAITGATRCWAPRAPVKAHVDACRPYLLEELEQWEPEVIIVMGNNSLSSVLQLQKISAQRGSVFPFSEKNIPVVPTYAPGILFNQPGTYEFMLSDFKKAKMARLQAFTEPAGTEVIVPLDLPSVYRMRDALLSADWITFDVETTGLNPLAPNAQILCFSFADRAGQAYTLPLCGQFCVEVWDRESKEEVIKVAREILESDVVKVAHNGKFDVRYIRRTLGIQVREFCYDTQLLYAMIHEERPHNLEHLRTLFTQMSRYDVFKDDRQGKEFVAEWGYAGYPSEVLWQYAGADVDATYRVAEALIPVVEEEANLGPRVFKPTH